MPYLTPSEVPESATCRALLIPNSTEWLALFSGALTELAQTWNWEVQGISIEDTITAVNIVLQGYYDGCVNSGCTQPGGLHVVRLNPETWAIEELINGEWTSPSGDYALPNTPAREEATAEERRCLAAANAVNALQLLYESLSDSWNEALSLQDAINAALAVLIGIVGSAFALPVAALVAVFIVLMSVVYETIEFITADLWDAGFTQKLTCYFYECALDTDDVVHFDIQCIIDKIGAATTFDWTTEAQLRLLLQVSWLMTVIGSQTIDAAGTATAIEDTDCDGCGQEWCYRWFGDGYLQGDWNMLTYPETTPTTYVDDHVEGGFQNHNSGESYAHIAEIDYAGFIGTMTFIGFEINFDRSGGSADNYATLLINGIDVAHSPNLNGQGIATLFWSGTVTDPTSIEVIGGVESDSGEGGYFRIMSCTARGTGANPIAESNCV